MTSAIGPGRMRSPASRLGPLLRACIHGDEPQPIRNDLPNLLTSTPLATALPSIASYHRVSPWVLGSLHDNPALPPVVADDLRSQKERGSMMHVLALGDLATLAASLDALGCRWLVFKGPVLAKLSYRRPELRPYSDIDVMVERGRFADAVSVLESAGSRIVDANWSLIRRTGAGQVHLVGAGAIDLHWNLVFHRADRTNFAIPTEELFERSVVADLNGITIHTFDPMDTLLHLCLHAAQEGAGRLLWLKDVEQVVARATIDWDQFIHRAALWQVSVPASVVLARSRSAVGARVPAEVLNELAPNRAWRFLAQGVDRMFPVQATKGEGNPATLIARNARRSELASFAVLAIRTLSRIGRLVTGGGWRQDRSQWDPRSPNSLLFPSDGGDRDRAAYLAWVQDGSGSARDV